MKGIELPINILVIVAIAVIILLGLVALYFVGINPFSVTAGRDAVKNSACTTYVRQQDCGNNPAGVSVDYDVKSDTDSTNDNLEEFLKTYYGCDNTDAAQVLLCIRRICACPGY